jgi:hypothetical protein
MRPEFPRIYRLTRGYRIFTRCCGIGFAAMGVWLFAGEPSWKSLVAGGLPLCLLGAYCLALVARVRVILHADRLETHGVFIQRQMFRRDIAGRRLVQQGHVTVLRLYSRSGARDLTLPASLETDAAFDAWFERPQPPTTTE